MDAWGTMALNITEYSRPPAEIFMKEKDLLPDPTNLLQPSTILQGAGRRRKRRELSGYCTKEAFDALEADFYAGTSRTLMCDDGFTMEARIEKFNSASRKLGSNYVFFSVTFIEA